ncbi:helix-turn-helix transcriptional regulator [Oxalicibacterium solurbis]|uniref:HTH luxR-type domain-containing protein n=1 Tax=Oxalicibacterium solurbis TaxID=69280 RepID=A0A8J3F4U7_9BURK|nr:LuxR family transcriptional regulator [Oxalicibacterium solurbis]GGI52873.1 hypothetical protein GCM10011430_00470 [Oxalicibacterium solurbis]
MARNDSGARLSDVEIAEISKTRRWADLTCSLERLLPRFGYCRFMQFILFTQADGKILSHAHGTLEPSFDVIFRESSASRRDPNSIHANGTNVPIEWTIEQMCIKGNSRLYDALMSAGIHGGISICSRSAQAVSRIDFYREKPATASMAEQADLLMLASYTHQSAEYLLRQQVCGKAVGDKTSASALSEREVECLGWSANGKTSAEIGMILGISQRTVYFHLRSVSSKLGVYGTRHAISKAVMMGIVAPRHNA